MNRGWFPNTRHGVAMADAGLPSGRELGDNAIHTAVIPANDNMAMPVAENQTILVGTARNPVRRLSGTVPPVDPGTPVRVGFSSAPKVHPQVSGDGFTVAAVGPATWTMNSGGSGLVVGTLAVPASAREAGIQVAITGDPETAEDESLDSV